jgi:hypothetical protein
MNTTWYRSVVRLMAGPVAAACVIGGAMGMSGDRSHGDGANDTVDRGQPRAR